MAFNMKPGRSPFMQTGRGIPSALLQVKPKLNTFSGEDMSAQAKKLADAKAKAKLAAAGENEGGSNNVRTFSADATVIKKAKPVEKFAKTPAEIAKWKAAPQANKDQYLDKSVTETVTVSDTGMDKPKETPTPMATPNTNNMSWFASNTNQKFGGSTVIGGGSYSNDRITEGNTKNAADTDPNTISQGNPFSTGEKNKFNSVNFTPQEIKLSNAGRIGVNDTPIGKDPVKHQSRLNALEKQLDANLNKVLVRKAGTKAKQDAAAAAATANAKANLAKRKVKSPSPAAQLRKQKKC